MMDPDQMMEKGRGIGRTTRRNDVNEAAYPEGAEPLSILVEHTRAQLMSCHELADRIESVLTGCISNEKDKQRGPSAGIFDNARDMREQSAGLSNKLQYLLSRIA